MVNVKVSANDGEKGYVRMAFEFSFPNEPGAERDRAFALIGRIMREALPDAADREEFLEKLEHERSRLFPRA